MDSTATCRPPVCYYTVTGWGVMSCVCGMAFLCGNTLVKVSLLQVGTVVIWPQLLKSDVKGRHKRGSKNAKQMRNTKQNCFSHSSASSRNNKQCSAKQCFANQTNRCLAGFASRSDLFRDNARLTKHRRKVNQRHLILKAMYTTMWLEIDCWLAVSHMFR